MQTALEFMHLLNSANRKLLSYLNHLRRLQTVFWSPNQTLSVKEKQSMYSNQSTQDLGPENTGRGLRSTTLKPGLLQLFLLQLHFHLYIPQQMLRNSCLHLSQTLKLGCCVRFRIWLGTALGAKRTFPALNFVETSFKILSFDKLAVFNINVTFSEKFPINSSSNPEQYSQTFQKTVRILLVINF